MQDFLNPDFTLIGEFDERSGRLLEGYYAQIMKNNPPCLRMNLENAELTKVAINTFVTTKITFANMLSELCELIPGGNVDVVTNALGFDKRIGPNYLRGAIGYGGPCFPRDNVALGFIARALGRQAELAETTDRVNRAFPERIIERLRPFFRKNTTVAILGLAYKPFSHVVEESQGIYLAKALARAGARVVAYDPLAGEMARSELHNQAVIMSSISDCLSQAELVLITTPDPAFKELSPPDFKNGKLVTVVDFWRILNKKLSGHPDIRYIPVGCSIDDEANAASLVALWNPTARNAM